jgi:hypothetical protein
LRRGHYLLSTPLLRTIFILSAHLDGIEQLYFEEVFHFASGRLFIYEPTISYVKRAQRYALNVIVVNTALDNRISSVATLGEGTLIAPSVLAVLQQIVEVSSRPRGL